MQTVSLGRSGVEVSALCLGAMFFGTTTDENSSYRLLDQYLDAGGTFIDTANIYAHWVPEGQGGESESLLGRWLKSGKNRDKLFIASKVGFNMPGVQQGLSAEQIETECNKSLQRMGIDTIDLYYAHVDDRITPLEETMTAFDRLVQAGKVRYIGASNYLAWRLEEAHWISASQGLAEFCCVQQRYTYLRPKYGATFGAQVTTNNDLVDYCRVREDQIRMLAYSVLLGGAYTRADRPLPEQYAGPDSNARLAALRDVADELDATPNQIVLAWMLHSDPVVIPLIAASKPEQLQENLEALNITLSADQMKRLDNASA